MTTKKKESILRDVVTNTFAKNAYRTILIAYTDISYSEYLKLKAANNGFSAERDREILESSLTIVGILAL